MSGIVWATLFVKDTEIKDRDESVAQYVAETIGEQDGRQFEVLASRGKVVVKYAGYAYTDDEAANKKLNELESVEYVRKAVLMGYSDTSNAGWGHVIGESEEDWMKPFATEYDGVEGARGRDVHEEINDEHGLSPRVPHFE